MTRMTTTLFIGLATLATTATTARAGTPPSVATLVDKLSYVWSCSADGCTIRQSGSFSCTTEMNAVTAAGVADSLTVDVPYDTPDFKKGPRSVKEIKALCKHAIASSGLAVWKSWVEMAISAAGQPNDDGLMAEKCIEFYPEVIKDGVKPTTKLPHEGVSFVDPKTGDPFSGTVDEAQQRFCRPRADQAAADRAAAEAPYRKVLKNDKLEVALEGYHIYLAGYVDPDGDPNLLAKANVWFAHSHYPDEYCNHGADTKYQLVRWQFNAAGKITKKEVKKRCGEFQASDFK